jgi:CheY-like chemotaxis protein/two-component sensor histidine kinase
MARKDADQALQTLSPEERLQIVAAASHDLRQPLQVIGLSVRSLKAEIHAPQHLQMMRDIETATRELQAIADDVLEAIGLDAGSRQPQLRAISLQTVFDTVTAVHGYVATEKGITLRVRPTAMLVVTDPAILVRALNNLISNAIKYTGTGGVLIGARRDGAGWTVEVWDTGIGILEHDVPQLFEPFRRGSDRARDRQRSTAQQRAGSRSGAGLGLFIVKRLTQLLGGDVGVRSRRGVGTVFKLHLPGPVERKASSGGEQLDLAPNNAPGKPFVAMLDDDPAVLKATRRAFEEEGCVCLACTDALDFLTRLSQLDRVPDLFVLDLLIGSMTADQILRVLALRLPQVNVVVVTGNPQHEKALALQNAGVRIIAKPLDHETIRTLLLAPK